VTNAGEVRRGDSQYRKTDASCQAVDMGDVLNLLTYLHQLKPSGHPSWVAQRFA
jgi:hypothetical protein